MALFSLTLSGQ